MLTTCILITNLLIAKYNYKSEFPESVWQCSEIGYVIQYSPELYKLRTDKLYNFEVKVDSKGEKTLILQKDEK